MERRKVGYRRLIGRVSRRLSDGAVMVWVDKELLIGWQVK